MSIPSRLPPELQEVEADLRVALREGGIEACQNLVDRLAVEAEMGQIILDGAESALLDLEKQTDTFPEIRATAEPYSKELARLSFAGRVAVVRHTYATMWLRQIMYGS